MTAIRNDAGEEGDRGEGKQPRLWLRRQPVEDGEPLSPPARLFREPKFNCHILAVMGTGKKIDVNVVKAGLEETLVRHPRFSSIQVLDANGSARWIRTQVNLADHLIIPDVDASAIPDPDLFIEDYVSSLSLAPALSSLEPPQPLWELHLLNLPTSEAQATAVFRIHHSLGDGTSLMSLLLACTRKTSDPTVLPTITGGNSKKDGVTVGSRKTGGILSWFAAAVAALWVVWNTVVDVALFLATTVGAVKDTETPIKGKRGTEFNRKRVVHRTVLLDDVKTVKQATNATINDVLLGVFSAGITRYLARRYGSSGIPTRIRVRAALLVNLRKPSEIQIAIAAAHRLMSNVTLSFSNVVGPTEEIGFCGNPVVYLAPTVYGHPQALTIHFQSYKGKMMMILAVDETVIPDPHQLCDDLIESLDIIKSAAVLQGSS